MGFCIQYWVFVNECLYSIVTFAWKKFPRAQNMFVVCAVQKGKIVLFGKTLNWAFLTGNLQRFKTRQFSLFPAENL